MQTVSIVALIGASNCLLLTVILFTNSKTHLNANRILSVLLGIETVRLFSIVVAYELSDFSNILLNQLILLHLITGPVLFFYTNIISGRPMFVLVWEAAKANPDENSAANINKSFNFAGNIALSIHLLPFFLAGLLTQFNRQWGFFDSVETARIIVAVMVALSMMFYGSVCLYRIDHYFSSLKEQCSSIDEISDNWLRMLCLYFIVAGGSQCALLFVATINPYSLETKLLISCVASILFCYFVTFLGFRESPLYGKKTELDSVIEEVVQVGERSQQGNNNRVKYSSSDLSQSDADHFYQLLVGHMESQRSYLDSGLRISQLAKNIGLTVPQVSQVINQCSKNNFYDFVNAYRIEASKVLMRERNSQKISMLALAEEVGFNSPSTFYKYFRKITGVTPKQYMSQCGNQGVNGISVVD